MISDEEIEEFAKQFGAYEDNQKNARTKDAFDELTLTAWDDGFDAALELLRKRGAVDVANDLDSLRIAYWKTRGVDLD